MSLCVTEKEFVKKIAPLVCMEGKKLQRMQAQQIYMILRDVGLIIIDKKKLQNVKTKCEEVPRWRRDDGQECILYFIEKYLGEASRRQK